MTIIISLPPIIYAIIVIVVVLVLAIVAVTIASQFEFIRAVFGIPRLNLSLLKGLSKRTTDNTQETVGKDIDVAEICAALNARTDDLSPAQTIRAYLQKRVPKRCTIVILPIPINPYDKDPDKNLETVTYHCHGKNFLKKGSVVRSNKGVWQPAQQSEY